MTRLLSSLVVTLFASSVVYADMAKVLIFSATKGYRHDSIPFANEALTKAGPSNGITFEGTESPSKFTTDVLSQYDAIVFMMTTDDENNPILNNNQQAALRNYIDNGGNTIGVHSATCSLYKTPWFGRQLGSYFAEHPELAPATFLNTLEPDHPTVSMIPKKWTYPEEVYSFASDPRDIGAKVVLTVEEKVNKYADSHGKVHPIAWYQEHGAGASKNATSVGRSFYTSLGHLPETWEDPIFLEHVMAGIKWTLGSKTTAAFKAGAKVGNAAAFVAPTTPAAATGAKAAPTLNVGVNNAQKDDTSSTPTKDTSAGHAQHALAFVYVLAATLGSAVLLGVH